MRRELGVTILLIEHDMKVVMGISDQVAVLDYGDQDRRGHAGEIQRNPRVIEAYLGRGRRGGERSSVGTRTRPAR